MTENKIKCRECKLVNEAESKCGLTGREVTLDSERNCKKGVRKDSK